MFKRILIANRGEIAVRIIRCCRELQIETVQVYSEADKDSLAVLLATKAVLIGPARAMDSYLNQDVLLETALRCGCDAIHPGYGFLSENAGFAKRCEECGIAFIGPSSEIISKMGDKQAARSLMIQHEVPVVPGSKGLISSEEEALSLAEEIGYPVLIKASAGGGGKGMRRAYAKEELAEAYRTAKAEAFAAFGNDDMYLEKLIEHPHHIEIQILADHYGNVVALGERDCSIQRKNQKLLEEAPSAFLTPEIRQEMCQVAVRAAKAAGYNSAGTIEFVVDRNKKFYFIEMNTRIQVEHPVTEEISGIDLIREQIRIAEGARLRWKKEDIKLAGHAIECRINAQAPGKITSLHLPAGYGIRCETHLYQGCEISPFYDSMIAKVIARGTTRLEAIRRMRRALEELIIEGIPTNAELMYLVTFHPEFIRGHYNTSFWEQNEKDLNSWLKGEVPYERK